MSSQLKQRIVFLFEFIFQSTCNPKTQGVLLQKLKAQWSFHLVATCELSVCLCLSGAGKSLRKPTHFNFRSSSYGFMSTNT